MNIYERLRSEEEQKRREKELKKASLEKQLKSLETQQKELRNVSATSLDPAFVRRRLDKCSEEITRINRILADL